MSGTVSAWMQPGEGFTIRIGIGNTGYIRNYAYNGGSGPVWQTIPFQAATEEPLLGGTYHITAVSYADTGAPALLADRTLTLKVQ